MYDRKYVLRLETLIMDELMPMYLVGCRVSGVNPRQNEIIAKLMDAMNAKEETPWLLKNENNI